jgi:2,4-diketo-3-deoxy-L-fuconate hydrolase
MRFANLSGRLQLVGDAGLIDVENASDGALPSDPLEAYGRWGEVLNWARNQTRLGGTPFTVSDLSAPSPGARQVFAIGLNYAPHAAESGFELPQFPFVFTKTFASLAGPFGRLTLPSSTVDWEVEVVAVIGEFAKNVSRDNAWRYIAGLTVGQDFSDREVQNRLGPNSQPTLGKSPPGFAPTGPFLVTADEFDDPNDIPLSCTVNGVEMQSSTTAGLIFGIPELVEYLSSVLPLYPGDLIFTGTPAGVGLGRNPPVYLASGDVIETTAARMGTMRHVAVSS